VSLAVGHQGPTAGKQLPPFLIFCFSPSAFVEPASTMPKYVARLRIAAAASL